jgi:hypothetical protein
MPILRGLVGFLLLWGFVPSEVGAEPLGARRPVAVTVIDGDGELVGHVVAVDGSSATVALKVGADVALVTVVANRFFTGTSTVAFQSGNCSGPPLLLYPPVVPGSTNLFRAVGIGPASTLFAENGPPSTLALASAWKTGLNPPDCGPFVSMTSVVPAVALLDLSTFASPFTEVLAPGGGVRAPAGRGAPGPLTVVDTAGRTVGPVYPEFVPPTGVVLIRAGGRAGLVSLTRTAFVTGIGPGGAPSSAFFEPTGCGGPAFVAATPPVGGVPELLRTTAIERDGSLVAATGPAAMRTIKSLWASGAVPPFCLDAALGTFSVRETEFFYDLAQHAGPFDLR